MSTNSGRSNVDTLTHERMTMPRLLPLATALIAAALITGCASGSPAATSTTPAPSPTPSSRATDSPEPTDTAVAKPADPFALTCDELLTRAELDSSLGAAAIREPTRAGGGGTTDLDILALMPAGALDCTWVLPGTDDGIVVSLMVVDAGTRAAVEARLNFYTADGDPAVTYWTFGSLDTFIFTETHAFATIGGLWVAVFTTGDDARDLAGIVWSRVSA